MGGFSLFFLSKVSFSSRGYVISLSLECDYTGFGPSHVVVLIELISEVVVLYCKKERREGRKKELDDLRK